ncbi:MAG: LarC family nickel insertion protein [Gammaproteobacteria bacterium]|nr:LarC family nickel insertion protein [Gammaproteobacteria bacterium]
MHLHLDPVGGVAGDMFVAAMLDAFPDLVDPVLHALSNGGLLAEIKCEVVSHTDHVLSGSKFEVVGPPADQHEQQHHHLPFHQLRAQLAASSLEAEVKRHAIDIFELLAQAEAKVHGARIEDVTFHEVAAWDSIADIVTTAILIDAVGAPSWSAGPLPLGSGRVRCAHGELPVPAPATTLLLEGFSVFDDGLTGERVTPTGAAILKYLGCNKALGGRPRVLSKSGIGFGTRRFPGISNILRVLVFHEEDTEVKATDEVAVLSFEVDDQTGEDLAVGLERIRAHPGVLDVAQIPAFGKKGRMLSHIQVLARPVDWNDVGKLCFRETSTLGVRWLMTPRLTLARDQTSVDAEGREVSVKIAQRPDSISSVKAEMDDIARHANGHIERENLRQIAEAEVLRRGDYDDG